MNIETELPRLAKAGKLYGLTLFKTSAGYQASYQSESGGGWNVVTAEDPALAVEIAVTPRGYLLYRDAELVIDVLKDWDEDLIG